MNTLGIEKKYKIIKKVRRELLLNGKFINYLLRRLNKDGYVYMTGPSSYEKITSDLLKALIKKAEEVKGEMINMCIAVSEALEESRAIGIEQGRNEGIMLGKQEGKISERLQCIQKIMNNLKISASEAMTILDIPITEQETINKLINQS